MLGNGEINTPEFMTLIYPDIKVYGIELKSEYDVELDKDNNARIRYLIAIAEKYPYSQDQIGKINDLITQKKLDEAVELMLNTDPWTREKYKQMTDKQPGKITTRAIIRQVDEIMKKAEEVSAQIDPEIKEGMLKTRRFFEVASKRSLTMVNYVAEKLIDKKSSSPIAISIGAAHTKEMLAELKSHSISYVQITPNDLNPESGQLSYEQFELKNKGKWAQDAPGTMGHILNSNKRNPRPIIDTVEAQSYASMNMASILLAESAMASNGQIPPIPDNLRRQLNLLPNIRIDYNSIESNEHDVIFNATLRDNNNNDVSVWARVGSTTTDMQTANNVQQANTEGRSIEQKLKAEESNVRLNNTSSTKNNTSSTKIVVISEGVKGSFAKDRAEVANAQQISNR
ncbi:hypothetical protein OMAG_000125 [Candidatus Omnitrophus magneticus]|uniref:Uncharacterized protein n=1 Tax=Candidatus Omnitrophus magneticus TaxID=1609969 RepID=A0A0F0CRP7_9BACT|nr:hypothetical protein OMAG_000125 [Candidatus Omnitrophus magneticus]